MSKDTPIYISILFLLISVVLFYIIAEWIISAKWTDLFGGLREGFANPQYTYKPNRSNPNLSITFGLSDLAIDISSVCGFIKVDSKLISIAAPTTSPSLFGNVNVTTTPVTTTTVTTTPVATTTPVPYVTYPAFEESSSSLATTMQMFASNTIASSTTSANTFTTSANTVATSANTIATSANTFTTSANTVATSANTFTTSANTIATSSATVSNKESMMSMSTNGDYTVPYTNLQIYTMYNAATGYSSTGNTNIYNKMDASYGSLFDSSQLSSMTDTNIAQLWNSNTSVSIDDAIFNTSNYFVIQSGLQTRQCKSGLSAYFVKLVQKNKSNTTVLLSLKNAYYAVVKQRFLMNTLSNIYWQNVQALTNSDKGTYNSVLFVLNTGASLANTNTLETDLYATDVAKIVSVDTPFTMDSIWLYQIASVTYELGRFVSYFQQNGANTSGSGTPAITTTFDHFISGYQQYLQKINQIAPNSPLHFALNNLPNSSDCASVKILSQHMNTILF